MADESLNNYEMYEGFMVSTDNADLLPNLELFPETQRAILIKGERKQELLFTFDWAFEVEVFQI